ncbi:stress-related protein-like [Phoenix dactylifera]|uniref:Stress-related protein-like n=1 Tax=Phoenix dactylifera TaxID=42345 RepID=A0A8B7CK29_PHODC|nr:stress-related protein-like [Phoenix dactylifera]
MAESNVQPDQIRSEVEEEEQRLRYLELVHVAALQAVGCVATVYEYARERAGPLKPGVQTVEGTVKTVVGPVYDKFHDAPFELLKFVDRKVGESVQELERHVPSAVKSVAGEVQRAGVVGTAAGLARAARSRYEPAAERCAVSAWRSLNRLPLFPQVAQRAVVPAAAHLSESYNRAVCYSAEKGYAVSAYLPLVPTDRIAKVFAADGESAAAAPATPPEREITVQ